MARNAEKRIFEEAKKIFLKFGWRRVTVDEICRQVGVTRKTFYTYYSNKNDLAVSVLNSVLEEFFQEAQIIYEDTELNFAQKIKRHMVLSMKFSQGFEMSFYEDFILSDDEEIIATMDQSNKRSYDMFVNVLNQAKQNGEVRDNVNIDIFFEVGKHLNNLCLQESFQKHFKSKDEMFAHMVELQFYGIFNYNN